MKVLITGAAQGLGRALMEELLQGGHEVIGVDKDIRPLDPLHNAYPNTCHIRLVDLAHLSFVEHLLTTLGTQQFDLVIFNAGVNATGPFEAIPSAAYKELITINLTTPLMMASSLVRANNMAANSKMVFISSLSHVTGYPGASVYGATKTALATYANSIKKPFAKHGIDVLTVFPGPIKTQHAQKHAPKGAREEKRMEPKILAQKILKVSKKKKQEYYPGFAARCARMIGEFAPNFTTRMMRRILFDKLEEPRY